MRSPPKFLCGSVEGGFARDNEGCRARGDPVPGLETLLVVASHAVVQTPAGWQHPEAAAQGFQRRRRTHVDTPERKADRAQSLIMMGECLLDAMRWKELHWHLERNAQQLRDPLRRPTTPCAPLLEALLSHQPELAFELDT